MSVLIKGMEMPTEGNETIIRIQPDGTILDQYGHHLVITAIHVPPHGRLIDADAALRSEQPSNCSDKLWAETTLARCINTAPTIIPAEEATDGV